MGIKNAIYIIIVLLLESCTHNSSMNNDLVDIISADYFEDDSFDSIIFPKSKIFNNSIICNPVRVALHDSILFSLDANYGSDTLVRCFSLVNKRYLGPVFLKGNGAGELLSAVSLGLSADSSSFWTFDITKQLWVGRPCAELSDSILLSDDSCTKIDMKDTVLLAKDDPIWLKDGFAVRNLFNYKERFFICDLAMSWSRPIVNPYLQFKEAYNEYVMADIFSSQMCTSPDRSIIILAGKYLDLIEIYDVEGNLRKMLKGPQRGFDFKFDVERSVKNSVLVKSKDTRRGYLKVKATQSKIYALYSGKSKQEEHYSYSRILYVFSLDGDLLYKYVLDKPIIDFVIDEKRNCIYATSLDAEIISFNL